MSLNVDSSTSSSAPDPSVDTSTTTNTTTSTNSSTGASGTNLVSTLSSLSTGQPLTIGQYAGAIAQPQIALGAQIAKNEENDYGEIYKKFDAVGADEAAALRGVLDNADRIKKQLKNLQTTLQQLKQQVNTINASIELENQKYATDVAQNEAMNNAIDAYNQATTAFQNGDITQAEYDQATADYQAALATYQAYADTRNPEIDSYNASIEDYNSTVTELNELIDQANVAIIKAGGTPIPHEPLAPEEANFGTPGQTNPVRLPDRIQLQEIDFVNLSPGQIEDAQKEFKKGVKKIAKFLKKIELLNETISLSKDNALNIHFFQRGKFATAADSYTDEHANPPASGGAGAAANVGFASVAGGLNSSDTGGAISNALFSAAALHFVNAPPEQVASQLDTFVIQSILFSGLFAGKGASDILGAQLPLAKPGSTAANLALNLGLTAELLKVVNSGTLDSGIASILKQQLGETLPANLADLVQGLSTSAKLQLLQFALFGIGSSLNSPGLAPQFIAYLQSTLEEEFPEEAAPPAPAVTSTPEAPPSASPSPISSDLAGFVPAPPTPAPTLTPSATAPPTPTPSATAPPTPAPTTSADTTTQSTTTTPTTPSAGTRQDQINADNLHQDILVNSLKQQLLNAGVDDAQATQSANRIADQLYDEIHNNTSNTEAQIRDRLNDLLLYDPRLGHKITDHTAEAISGQVNLGLANIAAPPLQSTQVTTPLSLDQLKQEVYSAVVNQLRYQLGEQQASDVAKQAVQTLFGRISEDNNLLSVRSNDPQTKLNEATNTNSSSLLGSFQQHFREMIIDQNLPSVAEAVDRFKDFMAPHEELHIFLNELLDPAKDYLNAAVGMMYAGHEKNNAYSPSTLPNTIDIGV